MGVIYRQFLGSKPGNLVEVVDASSSPVKVRTRDNFEYQVSAEDFRNYYREEDSDVSEKWFRFLTDADSGLINSELMSDVIEVIRNFQELAGGFDRARSFLKNFAVSMLEHGRDMDKTCNELIEMGWNPLLCSENNPEKLAGIQDQVIKLLADPGILSEEFSHFGTVISKKKLKTTETESFSSGTEGVRTASKSTKIRMKNVNMEIENGILKLVVDLSKEFGPSKSGKTTIIASTEGNKPIPGRQEKIGLNIYKQESSRIAKGRKSSFKNVEMKVEGDNLEILIDLNKEFGPSKSGKTVIVASTEGNQLIIGRQEKIGLNVYKNV